MQNVRTLRRLPLVVHAIPRTLRSLDGHLLDFEPRTELRGVKRFVVEFLYFGAKETRACLFVGLFFTAVFAVPRGGLLGISRYDLLLLIALAIQAWMLWAKLETVDEFKSICLFHVIGFVLEVAACTLGLYARATVIFRPLDRDRSMPLPLSFVLIGFFIWLAENISTFFGVWRYPSQVGAWAVVHLGIMELLVIAGDHHLHDRRELEAHQEPHTCGSAARRPARITINIVESMRYMTT
jgi:hypothetical protein